MANATSLGTMEGEAFLEWEALQTEKHYLHDGLVYAMAGASDNHTRITPALASLCVSALRSKPCRYRDMDTKILVGTRGNYYYPDGLIACPPRYVSEPRGAIDNPTVIFEVLSPSSWRFDREEKFDAYRQLVSLQEYVLIHSDVVRVEVFARQLDGKWGLSVYLPGTIVQVESVGIELPLVELYEEAVFEKDSAPAELPFGAPERT